MKVDVLESMVVDVPLGDTPPDEQDDLDERNPLDVDLTPNLNLGWINEFAELTTELTASPYEFNELTGLMVASVSLGRNAYIELWDNIYANIYAALISPSTVFHKSTALGRSRDILKRGFLENLLYANDMTYEGLIKMMSRRNAGLIVNNEIHRILGSHNTRYLLNLKPALTDLYDCDKYERELSSGTITIPEPYLCLYGATTPSRFHSSVNYIDWMDGFLVRWLFVLPESDPDFETVPPMRTAAHAQKLNNLAMTLADIAKQRPTSFVLDSEAYDLWNQWRIAGDKRAWSYGDEVVQYITGRYSTYALKFSLILSAVNGSWGQIGTETMQTAIHLTDNYKRNIYRLIEDKSRYAVTGSKVLKVFSIIKREGDPSTSTIMKMANMKKAELTPVLEKMDEAGYIGSNPAGKNGKHGRRYYTLVDAIPVRALR